MIHHAGRRIPARCLLEVKTQAARGSPPARGPDAQLYFSRRAQLHVAQHRDGVFVPPAPLPGLERGLDLEDPAALGRRLARWEAREQATLRRLAGLLWLLRATVRALAAAGGGGGVRRVALVCRCDGSGDGEGGVEIRVYERGEQDAGLLPP